MKPENIKEFKQLIKRYETITIEEIKKPFSYRRLLSLVNGYQNKYRYLEELTGFANKNKCILCKKIDGDCKKCVYFQFMRYKKYFMQYELLFPCLIGINKTTHKDIIDATTPDKLLEAYRARAKHMNSLLEKLETKNKIIKNEEINFNK